MNNFGRHLIPHYDELTLFVMSLICVLLFIVNIDFLRDAHFSFTEGDPGSLIIFIVFFAGLVLSVYHIIVRKIKTNLEKLLMLFFAVFLNAASGLTGGTYALEHSRGELAIFPIMNIVSGALLLYMARERIIDESSILETNIEYKFVWLAAGIALLIFCFCHYILNLYWASTFSICVFYATNTIRPVIIYFTRQKA